MLSLQATASSPLHSRNGDSYRPLSCRSKVFVGLKPHSIGSLGSGKPSLSFEFRDRVYQTLNSRFLNMKPSRARVTMMPIGVPRVPYKTPGESTWQMIDIWNVLYREGVIFIGQQIDEEFSNQILSTMLYLDSVDNSRRLYLYISCTGGDITPCMSLYDTLQSLESPVGTHCMGYAYNLAGFILAGGDKGYRTSMPRSRIALQPPAGVAHGQADDVQNETMELLRIRDYLFQELATKTGQPLETIYKDLRRIKHFNAKSAVEYGLIDRVIRPQEYKRVYYKDDS